MNNVYITNNIYKNNIYERYKNLKNSNKIEFDNNDLWKIFEYYSCIKLTEEYGKQFYEYNDIDPDFKEVNKMSRNDTGIDCCDLENTIVQCKLRKKSLTFSDCSTFFASSNIYSDELNESIIRWKNLIITRNSCSTLSKNLIDISKLFIDRPYSRDELIKFCDDLILTHPKYIEIKNEFVLRYYQVECINLIKDNKKNIVINLPTGSGKNSVIIHSLEENLKYLILVPRIILMEQLYEEIIKHKLEKEIQLIDNGNNIFDEKIIKNKLEKEIQLIGNGNNIFDEKILITICVYNSVYIIKDYCSKFEKIYIDEAHHINVVKNYYCNEEFEELFEEESEEKFETYIDIIKSFIEYNNNVYLSATIDKIDNFLYYGKDIRSMINEKYLCNYIIHLPIFSADPTYINICEYLLKYYRNIIIYCKSRKEGININKIMNTLQLNSSKYIDCNTSKKDRNDIINKYKNGDVPFLVNVRLLVEGFNCSSTQGVCFLNLPKCKTALIQIIGRCLRLDKGKVLANIILPYSVVENEDRISNFLKIIAKNDSRIRKSCINKILGGYISIDCDVSEIEKNDIKFKYEMIYNSIILKNDIILPFSLTIEDKNIISNFLEIIAKNDSRIEELYINKILENYISIDYDISKIENADIKFKHEMICDSIELKNNKEFILVCFRSNLIFLEFANNDLKNDIEIVYEAIKKNGLIVQYDRVKLQNNKKVTSKCSQHKIPIFKYVEIDFKKDKDFILEYVKQNINDCKYKNIDLKNNNEFILEYDKQQNIKSLLYTDIYINNDKEFRLSAMIHNKLALKFINIELKFNKDYSNHFRIKCWNEILNELKFFIDNTKEIPTTNTNKKLCNWIYTQKRHYSQNQQIMKFLEIKKQWKIFIENYKKYL